MSDFSLLGQLDQASGSEAGQVFRSFIREHVRDLICQVMAQEVSLLCGPKHQPTGGDNFRSGSSTGRIQIDGKREEIIRPRVRQRTTKNAANLYSGFSLENVLRSKTSTPDFFMK